MHPTNGKGDDEHEKALFYAVTCIVLLFVMTGSALAASFSGRIWTGKPIGGPGGLGYYCTASQNTSSNSVNPKAYAEAYRNGVLLASNTVYSNQRCVANCGNRNKPTSGYGYYQEVGGFAEARFSAGAWE